MAANSPAAVSIDYYIRLEQGKESNPSGPILDGLARALRLNEEEHTHLYALANHAAGRTAPAVSRVSRVVRPGVRQLLETVRPCPAYVLTRTSDLLAANPEALILFAGLTDWPAERRNTIRYEPSSPASTSRRVSIHCALSGGGVPSQATMNISGDDSGGTAR